MKLWALVLIMWCVPSVLTLIAVLVGAKIQRGNKQ